LLHGAVESFSPADRRSARRRKPSGLLCPLEDSSEKGVLRLGKEIAVVVRSRGVQRRLLAFEHPLLISLRAGDVGDEIGGLLCLLAASPYSDGPTREVAWRRGTTVLRWVRQEADVLRPNPTLHLGDTGTRSVDHRGLSRGEELIQIFSGQPHRVLRGDLCIGDER